MGIINLDGRTVVLDSALEVSFLPIGESSIVVEISFGRFQLDSLAERNYSGIVVSFPIERNSFVVVSEGVLGVYFDSTRVVLDCLVEVLQFIESETSVEQGFEMVREDF